MRKIGIVISFMCAFVLVSSIDAQIALDESSQKQMAMTNMESMPMTFTQNHGQWNEKVLFKASAGGATFWFCGDEIAYVFTRDTDELLEDNMHMMPDMADKFDRPRYKKESLVIRAQLIGANPNTKIVGENRLSHNCNYFYGNEPSKWRTDVPNYSSITYKNIYPGIDLKYHGNGQGMKYDFIVNPGAEVSQIQIRYEGADNLAITPNGDLEATTSFGPIHENIPSVYQEIGASKREVTGRYVIREPGLFGFEVDDYNPSLTLVIDPELVYSTYLGGSDRDYAYNIAVDGSGNAYVTGFTSSVNFPIENAYQANRGEDDVIVTKLSPAGNSLVYSTYLGGNSSEIGYGIAVDVSGNAYVTGRTGSSDFPTENPYDSSYNGGTYDVFVTKLSPAGNSLVYSTYLGGSSEDRGYSIAVDANGSTYFTGWISSPDFPTENPYDNSYNGGTYDVFVTKLSPAGDSLVYSTYLGGSLIDLGNGIAVDGSGSACVTGNTMSTDFPTENTYHTFQGYNDVFVTKLSPAGDSLVYSTYLGGSSYDYGYGIAIDGSGYAYIAGRTNSDDFPTLTPYQGYQGSSDVIVAKLSPAGNLVYSTYLGGNDEDDGQDIAVGGNGSAYVTGWTASLNFPTENSYDGIHNGGFADVIVTKLSPAGNSLVYSTYLGGSGADECNSIAVDAGGSAYVTGWTTSLDFPTENPYDSSYNGGYCDFFVAKFGPEGGYYEYLPGDVNMYAGTWPPSATGPDVTYLVNFFRGVPTSHSCLLGGFWGSADANGDCNIIGSDVTKLVNVFRGLGSISYCEDYPPAWPTPADLPTEAPVGWPNCETVTSGRFVPTGNGK